MYFLGLDTSNYTTSVAVLDEDANLLADNRIILPVPAGEKGLQQSTALFYHLKNLPGLLEKTFSNINHEQLEVIAVSCKPRPLEDSYMPVFTAGVALADSISSLLRIPVIKTTHQEGHIAAGLWSLGQIDKKRFLVFHLSGGTSELLSVQRVPGQTLSFNIEVMGASSDIHAGQLIDRVGVSLGLPFPSGCALEKMAAKGDGFEQKEEVTIPSSVKGLSFSFSGAETRAKLHLKRQVSPHLVARAVEKCIAATVEKVVRKAIEATGIKDIVFVGGVCANGYIRQRLVHRLQHPAVGANLFFPPPVFCSDNAVGTGVIGCSMIY